MVILLLSLTLGCKSDKAPPKSPAEPAPMAAREAPEAIPEAEPAEQDASDEEAGDGGADAEALYAECRGRVEEPEADGECETDEDCFRAGCSREVCTAKSNAMDVMTSCDQMPCFAVLDVCGCVEGTCTWSLKDGPVPEPVPPSELPQ